MNAVLDNATITAAFRALGLIPVTCRELFELDVCALRVLVEAMVLCDQIQVVDNYKEEYSAERKKWLEYDCFKFVELDDNVESCIRRNAVAHDRNWKLDSHLATELHGVFEDIAILFRHAWRHSESFLVLKSFGIENKYNSTLVRALQESVAHTNIPVDIRKGMTGKSYNQETARIVQSMSWAAIRATYYRQVGKYLGAEYLPHPLRSLYNAKCILFDNHPATRKTKLHSSQLAPKRARSREEQDRHFEELHAQSGYLQNVSAFFRNFWQDCNERDDNVFRVATFDIDMPPILGYVLHKLDGQPLDLKAPLDIAMELRKSREASSLRQKLSHIFCVADQNEQGPKIREFAAELRDLKGRMQTYLGYQRERVGVSAKLLAYELTVPRFMTKPLYPHKPHIAFVRDIILELASAGSLGRSIDLLWRSGNRDMATGRG